MSVKLMTPSETLTPDDDAVLFCPACGYDLRASSDGRCNECGLVIDRASLRVSAFPWAHRREMGRVRAYVRTVWQVLIGSRALAYETVKPQEPADARAFARVTGALVAVTLLLPLAAAAADAGGMGFLALPPNDPGGAWLTGWMQDLLVPWAAGATLWPVAMLAIVLFGFHLARAARPMFRAAPGPTVPAERAAAIASYTSAPLVLLLAGLLVFVALIPLDRAFNFTAVVPEVVMSTVIVAAALAVVGVVGAFARTGQWLARVRRGGLVTGVTGAVGLLGFWIAGAFVLLALLPWCFGFLWLVVDSLR